MDMKTIRWLNRHLWIFSVPALLATAALVACARPLLRWVGWPYGAYPAWLLRLAAAGALAAVGILGLRRVGKSLRRRSAGRELAEGFARMSRTCDPDPLLLTCRELQAVWLKKLHPELMMGVQMGLAAAAGRLGQIQEAEREVNLLLPAYERYQPEAKLVVELEAATVGIWAGNYQEAYSFLTEAERHLKQLEEPADSKAAEALENRKRFYRLMAEGGSEELLTGFRRELETSKDGNLMDQVSCRMNIARCLLSLGRPEEARPHLEFVAEHGGKLAIRQEALQRLAELECPRA